MHARHRVHPLPLIGPGPGIGGTERFDAGGFLTWSQPGREAAGRRCAWSAAGGSARRLSPTGRAAEGEPWPVVDVLKQLAVVAGQDDGRGGAVQRLGELVDQ